MVVTIKIHIYKFDHIIFTIWLNKLINKFNSLDLVVIFGVFELAVSVGKARTPVAHFVGPFARLILVAIAIGKVLVDLVHIIVVFVIVVGLVFGERWSEWRYARAGVRGAIRVERTLIRVYYSQYFKIHLLQILIWVQYAQVKQNRSDKKKCDFHKYTFDLFFDVFKLRRGGTRASFVILGVVGSRGTVAALYFIILGFGYVA